MIKLSDGKCKKNEKVKLHLEPSSVDQRRESNSFDQVRKHIYLLRDVLREDLETETITVQEK